VISCDDCDRGVFYLLNLWVRSKTSAIDSDQGRCEQQATWLNWPPEIASCKAKREVVGEEAQ